MDKKNPLAVSPWYKEGLRFKCTECGRCCTGPPGYVWITENEMLLAAAFLKIPIDLFKRRYTRQRNNRYALIERKNLNNEYDCVFLEGKKCQIYQHRPKQCRTYPWWKENVATEESWKRAAQECEGINDQAPLVPYSEILEKVLSNE